METVLQKEQWLNKDNSQGFFVLLERLRATSLPQKLREAQEERENSKAIQDGHLGHS
jgi:hypothetical protein